MWKRKLQYKFKDVSFPNGKKLQKLDWIITGQK
jgi:hypothetical protein